MRGLRTRLETILSSGSGELRRPVLRNGSLSNIPGLYVIGDLAGAPVIKLAMAQGSEVIERIAALGDMQQPSSDPEQIDILVVGAGAAGLNAALAARERGYSCLVLEKERIANTIENFPEGKWVYAEPDTVPPVGKLWLDGARKEDLVRRWHEIVEANRLEVKVTEPLVSLERLEDGTFLATSSNGTYRARKVVLATGQRGNPRKLGVPGEEQEWVYHRLYSPRKYAGEKILVVGGGNSAIEAALTLAEHNDVVLAYRGSRFARLFKENRRLLDVAIREGRIEPVMESNVSAFGEKEAALRVKVDGRDETRRQRVDHAFVLIGAELPVRFLRSLGVKLENDWSGSLGRASLLALLVLAGLWLAGGQAGLGSVRLVGAVPAGLGGLAALVGLAGLVRTGSKGDRWSWLLLSFVIWYSIYGIKAGNGEEFWPFRGWGYAALSLFDRPWSFWYTVLYTLLMTGFGLAALRRWGLDRKDRFQIWRFISLLCFQWITFFLIPEFLFQWAVEYRWVGESLAANPQFADQAWRSYGLVLAWPLFFYTFFYDPHLIWILWGLALTFVVIPVFVLFQGKRYCSWICGCGGLAETFGDRWRHLAPKGKGSLRWEWMNQVVLGLAVAVTLLMLARDGYTFLAGPADWGMTAYRIGADIWLVGILPVTLYPFLGGKVWCRYWCPLAKLMGLLSGFYARLGISRFKIEANDKCIACGECSRNCQVGIPVMEYALKQERLDNATSSCIGCGICVTVCPMDTLSFGTPNRAPADLESPALDGSSGQR